MNPLDTDTNLTGFAHDCQCVRSEPLALAVVPSPLARPLDPSVFLLGRCFHDLVICPIVTLAPGDL